MKSALAFCLMFIHVIALSSVMAQIAKDEGWHTALALLAWIGGGMIGLVPVVRSLAVIVICFSFMPWTKAIWIAPVSLLVLSFLEGMGTTMTKLRKLRK